MNYQRFHYLKKVFDSMQQYDTYKSLGDLEEAIKALQVILDSEQKYQEIEKNFKKADESLQHYCIYETLGDLEEAIKALQAILDSEQKQQSTDID